MRYLMAQPEVVPDTYQNPPAHPAIDANPSAVAKCSMLEQMPKWLICIPLTLQWLWLSIRYQSLTLPTVANPDITAGGLVGEGKLEYFESMGPIALSATAAYCALPNTRSYTSHELQSILNHAGLSFPVIAKPDVGLCGHGVRLVATAHELLSYLAAFPEDETVVLQQYLAQDGEAGIFYVRDPDADAGSIIGLALRSFPRITGDGRHSIAELIAADPRAQRLLRSTKHQSSYDPDRLPAANEMVRLATIGSTRVGGLYADGRKHITPELNSAIDAIARDMPNFYFGRFDVRFDSLEQLAAGRAFSIMEINGAGSEAIQAWDPNTSVIAGFATIFRKQRILFAIGNALRRKGFKPLSVFALAQLNRRQNRLIARYPPSN